MLEKYLKSTKMGTFQSVFLRTALNGKFVFPQVLEEKSVCREEVVKQL